jgi:hypothetical protein
MMADWIDTSEGILEENLAAASAIGNAADSASLPCRQDVYKKSSACYVVVRHNRQSSQVTRVESSQVTRVKSLESSQITRVDKSSH